MKTEDDRASSSQLKSMEHTLDEKMIGKSATAVLYSLLKDGEKRPVEEIIVDFSLKIPCSLHLEVCSALVLLLEEVSLKFLKAAERLVAFAILHHAYSSLQSSTNPYFFAYKCCK